MKKGFKIIGLIVGTVMLTIVAIVSLFYFPPFQQWAVNKTAAYVSEQTGMQISVDRVRLKFPLRLSLQGVKAEKSPADFRIDEIVADVQFLPLLRKQIEIDQLELRGADINTGNLIKNTRVSGTIQSLALQSHGINLKKELVRLDLVELTKANLNIELADTAQQDTTQSHLEWTVLADQLRIKDSKVSLTLADNNTKINADIPQFKACNGNFDLGKGRYQLGHAALQAAAINYDISSESRKKGFDTNHLALTDVNVTIDNLVYQEPKLSAMLTNLSFKEQSGVCIKSLNTPFTFENGRIDISQLQLVLAPETLAPFLGAIPGIDNLLPKQPIKIEGKIDGDINHLSFNDLQINSENAFHLEATGTIDQIADPQRRRGDVRFTLDGKNMAFVNGLLPRGIRQQIRIPRQIAAKGHLTMEATCYHLHNLLIQQGGGSMSGSIDFCEQRPTFTAHLTANRFPLQHFLYRQPLSPLTGTIHASGAGTDVFSPATSLRASMTIKQLSYNGILLDNTKATATLQKGWTDATIEVSNALISGNMQLHTRVNKQRLEGSVVLDLINFDIQRAKLSTHPASIGLCGYWEISSNLKDDHQIDGTISDIIIHEHNQLYRPNDATLHLSANNSVTRFDFAGKHFNCNFSAQAGYQQLLSSVDALTAEFKRQYKARQIDQQALSATLPEAHLKLNLSKELVLMRVAEKYGYAVRNIEADLQTSPREGINGHVAVDSLVAQGVQLDEIHLAFRSDQDKINYEAQVRNNKNNPQATFNALMAGSIYNNGTQLTAQIFDANNKVGVSLGVNGTIEDNGIRFTPYGEDPILGYKQFHIGKDNYVRWAQDERLQANVTLRADDGTGVKIYSLNDNPDALQDITISLHQFDLEKVLSVIPYTPHVAGRLNGDFHLIQTEEQISVASAIDVQSLIYEHAPMGNLSAEFIYTPHNDGAHYIDGMLFNDGKEVAQIVGSYLHTGEGQLDAQMKLMQMPLEWCNGFIEDQVAALEGKATGTMSVVGSLSRPKVDGTLRLDSAYFVSIPYGVRMRFDEAPLKVENSNIVFKDFKMYGYNDSPLQLTGSLNFSNLNKMRMDLRLRAHDFLLINAKETARSEAYGKAYVNLFASLQGELNALSLRGRLDVLGATDLTYILRDTPLNTNGRMEELVTFVNTPLPQSQQGENVVAALSNPTASTSTSRQASGGLSVNVSIGVDETAHIKCALNPEQSSYVDIIGGGTLRMTYNDLENLRLTGRYTLSSGEMKYQLPIIPLTTFDIKDGSYIEFIGDPFNPRLNITATDRKKASVSDGTNSRTVEFECGVKISKQVSDMGLEFIIEAPEDLTVGNQLAAMSTEERAKIAVTMLTTGMYLADGNTSNFTMNSALSAFLQSQINTIAGNALRTVDLSFGVDNSTNTSGKMQTDYSFKFAKRFWNNRINIQVGGKVSTGSDVENQNRNFFDNVIFEYRLNKNASKYLKLFYKRQGYDWLEGDVGEFGAGFIWKRKVEHFKDLFQFKEKPLSMPRPTRMDTIQQPVPEPAAVRE